jgi:hypothetical protein
MLKFLKVTYQVFGFMSGAIVFLWCYIYSIGEYGFLFGVGLGWLPSLIVGFLTYVFWPIAFPAFLVYVGGRGLVW